MEPLSLALMVTAAGKVVDSLLGDSANRLVTAVVGGVIGNRADRAVCGAAEASWGFFRNLRSEDPSLNHDLERATRESYLLATLELLAQAEQRLDADASKLLNAADRAALTALRQGAESDLRNVGNTLPEPLTDVHLFLVDATLVPAERQERLRQRLHANLSRDAARWSGSTELPAVVADLLQSGWAIDTRFNKKVPRDWYSLIALAFIEKLKSSPRLSAVFEAKLLSVIASREPAAAPVATFEGFSTQINAIVVPLQRIEDRLEIVLRGVEAVQEDVRHIRRVVDTVTVVPRPVWIATFLLVLIGALGATMRFAPTVACALPGVALVCGELGVGGVASKAERALWESRQPGDCEPLRAYLSSFPSGAYQAEARSRLEARRKTESEAWTPAQRQHPVTVRSSMSPFTSEPAARADAVERSRTDAALVCGPYSSGEFRLLGTSVAPGEWRCLKNADGFRCGFDGLVTCRVEARTLAAREVCE